MTGTLRYGGYMLRDLARGPGAIMIAAAVLAALILSRIPSLESSPAAGRYMLGWIVDRAALPFVLLATGGMVSRDLHGGYYRAVFSKPVDPVSFYLQRWLLGALIVGLSVPLFAGAVAVVVGPVPFRWTLLANVELFYLLLGGLVFLLSTFTRRDWLFALMLVLVQTILHTVRAGGISAGTIVNTVYAVLPPFHLVGIEADPPAGADLAYVVLYGGGLVLGALALLRWRAMGSGGRA